MSGGGSIYPFRQMVIVCGGCKAERMVPNERVVRILSAEDLKAFTDAELEGCQCGAKTCDLRILPAEGADLGELQN